MAGLLRSALITGLVLGTGVARAQSPPDLSELVVQWARGRYASPVMCEIDGQLVRGIRRVLLRDARIPGRPVNLLVQFVDMRPGEATRCVNATGRSQPNLLGKLVLRLPGIPHPETASRDFKQTLKRDHGFDLEIAQGALQVETISEEPREPAVVDFKGGRARLGRVMPATDADRELSGFQSPRKLLLELEPKAGEKLVLPLFLFDEG